MAPESAAGFLATPLTVLRGCQPCLQIWVHDPFQAYFAREVGIGHERDKAFGKVVWKGLWDREWVQETW